MIIQILAAFVATVFFSLLFNISRKELIFCGSIGALGWGVYLLLVALTDLVAMAALVATLLIGIVSQVFAKTRKHPVTIYQIAGIIPLVPGIGMYNSLHSVVLEDFDVALVHLSETIQVASAIAVGMLMVASVNKVITDRLRKKKSYKYE